MNFFSQPDMVRASLNLADTCAERHGCYRNRVVPGGNAEPTPGVGVESQSRVYARRPEEAGSDGSGVAPTHCTRCGCRFGDYITDRLIDGRSAWAGSTCPSCVWDLECEQLAGEYGVEHWISELSAPTPRQIPGTRRAS